MFETKVVEKTKTHFVFSNFFFENVGVYGALWKNMVEPDRPQIIYHSASALHAGYLRRQTLRICKIYCLFTAAVVTRTHLSITFLLTVPVLFSMQNFLKISDVLS